MGVERQATMETSAPPILGKEKLLAERQFHEVWGLVILFRIFDFGLRIETESLRRPQQDFLLL